MSVLPDAVSAHRMRHKRALVFPGQGAQVVGMGRDLCKNYPAAKEVFDMADEALQMPLSKLIFDGLQPELTLTENAQPAILTTSIAILRVLEAEHGFDVAQDVDYALGHSLGEYSALVAINALAFNDAVRLVRLRGQSMRRATQAIGCPTRMTALVVAQGKMGALRRWCADTESRRRDLDSAHGITPSDQFSLANINSSTQAVLSGTKEAVDWAASRLHHLGLASRTTHLPVSAPFHCELMRPAASEMQPAINNVTIKRPCIPIVSNVIADPVTDPAEIAQNLVTQITSPVEWCQSLHYCRLGQHASSLPSSPTGPYDSRQGLGDEFDGVSEFICIGPGAAVRNLIRKELAGVITVLVDTADDVREFRM